MFQPSTRILVVDDMPTIRELVKSQLRTLGFKNIIEAGDGDEALQILVNGQSNGTPIHLVISDWNMPKMKGLDLLKQVRAMTSWENLPFILLTSESDRAQVTEAVLSGVSQYIVKPFSPKTFEEKLKSVWEKYNKKG